MENLGQQIMQTEEECFSLRYYLLRRKGAYGLRVEKWGGEILLEADEVLLGEPGEQTVGLTHRLVSGMVTPALLPEMADEWFGQERR